MTSTQQQRLYIANYIRRNHDEHVVFNQIWNNIKPSKEGVDDREMVLADKIKGLTSGQADYWIKAYIQGKNGYHVFKARNILLSVI